jgi:hypothetical protein
MTALTEVDGGRTDVARSAALGCASGDKKTKFVDCVRLICLLGIVSAYAVQPARCADEDLWWHLRTGSWILQHHAVPTHDVFARYTMGQTWIEYAWLFDVLLARIYDRWGLHGILTLTALVTLSFVAAVVLLLARYGRMSRAVALAALVYVAAAPLITPRPWLFTCVFFVLELFFLLEARERGQILWLLPVVLLLSLWANLHIQFVYGLGVIGIFALERPFASLLKWPPPIAPLGSRWFWALLITSLLATLANPYGWRLYSVVAQYTTETAALRYVQEMQAMHFRSVTDWTALFLVCSAFFAIAKSANKDLLILALLSVSVWFGFRSGRDVWFLAITSALALAASSGSPEPGLAKTRILQWAVATPMGLAAMLGVLHSSGVSGRTLRMNVNGRFPEQAAEYIEKHRMQMPLYNPYGWGGYLIWRLPGMPVAIDGRANLHGNVRLTRFNNTWSGKRNWSGDPELMKANTIILEKDSPLTSILASDSRFRMVYDDNLATVFQPSRAVRDGVDASP